MNLLIINDDYRIDKTPPGIINSIITNVLNKKFSITVLTKKINQDLSWLDSDIKIISFDPRRKENINFLERIPKIRGLITAIRGFDSEKYNELKNWEEKIKELLLVEKFDAIFVINGLWIPLFAFEKIKPDIPLIIHVHDPYPLILAPEPYKSKFRLRYYSQFLKLKKIIKKASAVTYPSLLLSEWMEKYYPHQKGKTYILPHIYDTFEKLSSKKRLLKIIDDKNKFNVAYQGNLKIRDVSMFVEAAKKMIIEDDEFKEKFRLYVIGNISNNNLNQLNKIKENIKIINQRISFVESIQVIKEADLQLIIEARMPLSPFLPSKYAYIVGNNKPFLALTPKKSEIRRISGESYPYLADPNDEEEIYQALKKAWIAWKNNKLVLENAGRQRHYVSPEHFLKEFDFILKEISKKRN